MAVRAYTFSTCLDKNSELSRYFDEYVQFYTRLKFRVFKDYITGVVDEKGTSKYSSEITSEYGILRRTVNSILHDVKGRVRSYDELKQYELKQLVGKIEAVKSKIETVQMTYNHLKPIVAENKASQEQLIRYRNTKISLFNAKRKLDRLRCRKDSLELLISNKDVSFCFGSKALFHKQFNLAENGYKSHEKWLNDFRKARFCGIYYLGSSDETCGNQMFQISKDNDLYRLKVRKENRWCDSDKYIVQSIKFKHKHIALFDFALNNVAISVRPVKRKNRWYLLVSFLLDHNIVTSERNGVIGLDFNNGFIACAVTDKSGNLIDIDKFVLRYHGGAKKAESEMREVINLVCKCALLLNVAISYELLDFSKKKGATLKGKQKGYNRMLHALDYSRYIKTLKDTAARMGVKLVGVNPYNTSKIGKQKYCFARKLNVHTAAAYVIARRGQGFDDKLVA